MKPWRDEDTLRELYVGERMSHEEIADRLGCTGTTAGNWIRRHGIERDRPYRDEGTLRELYWEKGLSCEKIADRFDVDPTTIHNWLTRHGIERRKPMSERPPHFHTTVMGYEAVKAYNGETYDRVAIHRLLAVAEFGFDAVGGRVVHHKSGVPWDNRPSNLELMTQSDHASLHND